jgi:hypothetical protein
MAHSAKAAMLALLLPPLNGSGQWGCLVLSVSKSELKLKEKLVMLMIAHPFVIQFSNCTRGTR